MLKGRQGIVLIELPGLASHFVGRGSPAPIFFEEFTCLRRTPPPHPRAGLRVWCGL
jgi:hypothetical protein